jgi:hypothetical protein
MSTPPEISKSMEEAIKDPSLQETTAALAEVALDAALDPGVLKDIPMIGTVIGLLKTAHNIRDRLFLRKLQSFLVGLQDVDAAKRQDMIDRVNQSGNFRVTVGEKLLYILDKCADYQDAEIMAHIFKAFLEQRINYNEFIRLAHAVDQVMFADLMEFVKADWVTRYADETAVLLHSGLVEISPLYMRVEDQWDPDKAEDKYAIEGGRIEVSVTDLGIKLRDILQSWNVK